MAPWALSARTGLFFTQQEGQSGRWKGVHTRAFTIAVRLLAGEVMELADEHGRRWRASATVLAWVLAGDAAPVLEGSAADIAIEIARRELAEEAPKTRPV